MDSIESFPPGHTARNRGKMSNGFEKLLVDVVWIFGALLLLCIIYIFWSWSQPVDIPDHTIRAVCNFRPNGDISGRVTFLQRSHSDTTSIQVAVKGLKPGKYAFHIHELGDITQGDCTSAGGHYNPFGKEHGGPTDTERHVGDLGSLTATGEAESTYSIEDHLVTLSGPHSVLGRSCVLHAGEDDLGRGGHPDSKTTGHAGSRLICGVIGLAKQE